MTQTTKQLTARVRELEEENARLQALMDFDNERLDQIENELEEVEYLGPYVEGIKVLKKQLAASQLNAEQLREALTRIGFDESCFEASENPDDWPVNVAIEALNKIQTDAEALDAYVAEKVKEYKEDMEAMARLSHNNFEYVTELTKQRDLAVEALETIATGFDCDNDDHRYSSYCRKCEAEKVLSAIKESEK